MADRSREKDGEKSRDGVFGVMGSEKERGGICWVWERVGRGEGEHLRWEKRRVWLG